MDEPGVEWAVEEVAAAILVIVDEVVESSAD
jgi:hypothetical protein